MTALVWDDTTARRFERGLDRGVFYPSDGPGVPWNGLLSVVESSDGKEQRSYAVDGVTYLSSVGASNFTATVKAISAPREFSPYVGDLEIAPGVILTKQPSKRFGFCYRTLLGDTGYKIHLVYNATAVPTSRAYATTSDTPSPVDLEWSVSALPDPKITGYRPSAHFVVNSTKIAAATLATLEGQLYGSATVAPFLPAAMDLIALIDPALVGG